MIYIIVVNVLVVALAVLIHYEFLYHTAHYLPKIPVHRRYRIVVGTFGLLTAHTIEICMFAVAYYWMNNSAQWGSLKGNFTGSLLDCVYFSFSVYSTLGFGDITPHGDLRFLVGLESLAGLMLITWTASFLYLEMKRHWNNGDSDQTPPSAGG
jgi:hypothetical protein